MNRIPLLFTMSFCLPVFGLMAACGGPGAPAVGEAPNPATADAAGVVERVRKTSRYLTLRYELTISAVDADGAAVIPAFIEIRTSLDDDGGSYEGRFVPEGPGPWTIPATVTRNGKTTLRAVGSDGRASEPLEFGWLWSVRHPGKCGTSMFLGSHRASHVFRMPTR